ncbi:MAG: ATP-binding protein [Candidatus Nanopelagicales bacterium]
MTTPFATELPLLTRLFPFLCVLDRDLVVAHAGPSLVKLLGRTPVGEDFAEVFTVDPLYGRLDAGRMSGLRDQLFVARVGAEGLRLRGQVIEDPETGGFLVAWSPWISSTQEFDGAGFRLDDFGVQDPIVDMIHLLQAFDRAQREAAAPLEQVRRFFKVAPDLMLMLDPTGRMRRVNHACEVFFGRAADGLRGADLRDWLDQPSRDRLDTTLASVVGTDRVETVVLQVEAPGLGWRTLEWAFTSDPDGGVVFATARDTTQAEETRRVATRILQSAPNAMLMVDPAGQIRYANVEADRLFGRPLGGLVGRSIEELVPPGTRSRHVALREGLTAGGLPDAPHVMGQGRDLTGVTADGTEIDLQITLTSLAIDGRPHTLASVVDISARKALEQELLATRDAALVLARTKADILANTSHEIRTPLTAILGMTDLMLDTELTPEQQEMLGTARTAGERLLSLVNDILTLSKADAGAHVVESIPFSVVELVEECASLVAAGARAKHLDVVTKVRGGTPASVVGDREKLRAVVLNLAGNAVKFTEEGGVELSVGPAEDGQVSITVRDTGIGIDPDRVPHLFEPFVQADASTTRQYGGTGLGLAISRQLVEVVGGTLAVRSVPGEGSTFTVTVPYPAAAEPMPRPESTAEATPPSLHGLRVLLVEDNLVNAVVVSKMLEKAGVEVVRAGDGREALERIAADSPDLVLMDCHMPTMDGFDATRALRARESGDEHLTVIALTAGALDEDRQRCFDAGMDDFMTKPVTLDALTRMLARHAISDRTA